MGAEKGSADYQYCATEKFLNETCNIHDAETQDEEEPEEEPADPPDDAKPEETHEPEQTPEKNEEWHKGEYDICELSIPEERVKSQRRNPVL